MQFCPDTFKSNPGFPLLREALYRISARCSSMQATQMKPADAGLSYLHDIVLKFTKYPPKTNEEFNIFLCELKSIAGIFVLIAGGTSYQTPFWQEFQNIAFALLSAYSNFKKINVDKQ